MKREQGHQKWTLKESLNLVKVRGSSVITLKSLPASPYHSCGCSYFSNAWSPESDTLLHAQLSFHQMAQNFILQHKENKGILIFSQAQYQARSLIRTSTEIITHTAVNLLLLLCVGRTKGWGRGQLK